MEKTALAEEQIAYAPPGGGRDAGRRGLSEARNERADLLPLETAFVGMGSPSSVGCGWSKTRTDAGIRQRSKSFV